MRLRLIILTLALASFTGCAHTPPNLTPSQQTAFQADRLVRVLGVIQDAAISANASGFLSTADTTKVINIIGSAITTIQAAPSGWLVTVQTGLNQILPNITLTGTAKQDVTLAVNLALAVISTIQTSTGS